MISYEEIRFDIRVLWITSTFPEWIMLANQGTTVYVYLYAYLLIYVYIPSAAVIHGLMLIQIIRT
jgi:hypothetical protein